MHTPSNSPPRIQPAPRRDVPPHECCMDILSHPHPIPSRPNPLPESDDQSIDQSDIDIAMSRCDMASNVGSWFRFFRRALERQGAACCNLLPHVATCCHLLPHLTTCGHVFPRVATSCHMYMLPRVAMGAELLPMPWRRGSTLQFL